MEEADWTYMPVKVNVTGLVAKSQLFGYYEEIDGGDVFVFTLSTEEGLWAEYVKVVVPSYPEDVEADLSYLEDMGDMQDVLVQGSPVLINGEMYLHADYVGKPV